MSEGFGIVALVGAPLGPAPPIGRPKSASPPVQRPQEPASSQAEPQPRAPEAQVAVSAARPTRLISSWNAGAPEHLNVGDRVGRYRTVEFIGRGGMGSVFAGHDPVLERKVAIKVLHRDIGLSTARLESEGQTLAQLQDPHIVEVYDVGVSPEGASVVMELVAGASLREWLLTPRSLRAVLDAFMDAAAALSSAHRCDIVHGDFKPANVIVGEHGRVCVIDFGLAAPAPTTTDSSAPSNAVAGTPGYLAPELLEGCAATPDSDQYAFCVALQRALEAPTCRSRPSSRLRPALARGPHPDPQARWPTMDALRNALHGAFRPARALGVARVRRRGAACRMVERPEGAGAGVRARRRRRASA